MWMWEREHIPHVLEVWEPRRSIRGSKRGHQRSRMILEDVDTTITSPKSINSIPLDYVSFLFIKHISPRSFHFSHLRWFPHPQQWDKNTADASKSQRGSRPVWRCLGVTVKQPYHRQDRKYQELTVWLDSNSQDLLLNPTVARWYGQRQLQPNAVTSAAVQLQITGWKIRRL